ncbi:hypothetical protein V8G54_029167 [Vigna mungo]|uniref:Uncharacterized protein n=1 Tax=Vigna mungo TaxID=3915 RepID=A0AAQ3RK25_VIGMU
MQPEVKVLKRGKGACLELPPQVGSDKVSVARMAIKHAVTHRKWVARELHAQRRGSVWVHGCSDGGATPAVVKLEDEDPPNERLSRLEATLNNKEDARNEENTKVINDLQSKLKTANAEIVSEKEKIRTLTEENAKLQYRLIHLARSLKEANLKLEQVSTADVSFNGFD